MNYGVLFVWSFLMFSKVSMVSVQVRTFKSEFPQELLFLL